MKIKICGITSTDAAVAAAEAGAHWIGFVFAESPRRVEPAEAREISTVLPAHVETVAVFRHPSRELVADVVGVLRPDWIQSDVADFAGFGNVAPARSLPVFRPATLDRWDASNPPATALFEGPVSGSGQTADWSMAARLAATTHLILAGGLNAGNVAAAVTQVRPYGVDVSSGVEQSPGIKDPLKIREFIAAAGSASAQLESRR